MQNTSSSLASFLLCLSSFDAFLMCWRFYQYIRNKIFWIIKKDDIAFAKLDQMKLRT